VTRFTPVRAAARRYAALLASPSLAEHAEAIRALGKRVAAEAIEIGRRLVICRDDPAMKHGMWSEWLKAQFNWERSTAENFIHIYEASAKNGKFPILGVPLSALYLLAAPKTPDEAREEVIRRVEAGEKMSLAKITEVVSGHKKQATQAPVAATEIIITPPDPLAGNPIIRAWRSASAVERTKFVRELWNDIQQCLRGADTRTPAQRAADRAEASAAARRKG